MRHRKKTVILDRRSGPRKQLLRGLAVNVILRERVETTAAKARAVKPIIERCVTRGKTATIVSRRKLTAILNDRRAVAKIIEVLGPRYRERAGGYLRILRLRQRAGDGAAMVMIAFV